MKNAFDKKLQTTTLRIPTVIIKQLANRTEMNFSYRYTISLLRTNSTVYRLDRWTSNVQFRFQSRNSERKKDKNNCSISNSKIHKRSKVRLTVGQAT